VLIAIKVAHTIIWGLFVTCIVGMPVAGALRRFDVGAWMAGAVLVECASLAANRGQSPLTPIAARFSEDQRLGFDIYLPGRLLCRHKTIFGTLFVLTGLVLLAEWWLLGAER
jgi:hypothetical protein